MRWCHLILVFILLGCLQETRGPSVEYTVMKGDSLARIAKRHEVSVEELRQWNTIDGNLIHPGQVLIIHRVDPSPPVKTRRHRGKKEKAAQPIQKKLPPLKACLPPPSVESLLADEGFRASNGLSMGQLRKSMNRILPDTLTCANGERLPTGTVLTEITVACSGRVNQIQVIESGPYSPEFTSCVQETLRYTSFPAHDMPDGYQFEYPLRFSFE